MQGRNGGWGVNQKLGSASLPPTQIQGQTNIILNDEAFFSAKPVATGL